MSTVVHLVQYHYYTRLVPVGGIPVLYTTPPYFLDFKNLTFGSEFGGWNG